MKTKVNPKGKKVKCLVVVRGDKIVEDNKGGYLVYRSDGWEYVEQELIEGEKVYEATIIIEEEFDPTKGCENFYGD